MKSNVSTDRRQFLISALTTLAPAAGAIGIVAGVGRVTPRWGDAWGDGWGDGGAVAALGDGTGDPAAEGPPDAIDELVSALHPAQRVTLDQRLTFPVIAGAGLTVLNNFGGFSESMGACAHRGIDIFPTDAVAPRMLVSCIDGVIADQRLAPNSGSQGNAWILRDAFGVSYRYHHLDRFESGLEVGSVVKRGDVIGVMGMSGNTRSPHLHFEVRLDGSNDTAVDPIPLLALPIDNVAVGRQTGCR
jgi:murein DD-endopeptidase MepM/ murein hydrolase activator NlpD